MKPVDSDIGLSGNEISFETKGSKRPFGQYAERLNRRKCFCPDFPVPCYLDDPKV